MRKVKICGIQISAKPLAVQENLEKIAYWTRKAVNEFHPDLIVFPESITTTFSPGVPFKEFLKYVDTVPGFSTQIMCNLCKKLGVDMVLPIYERDGDKIYNAAVYISKNDGIIGVYRKTHLFPTERRENNGWSTPGNRVVTVETDFGKVGLILCYDGDFPELSRLLALNGAEIIIRPSAFLRSFDIWELTNKARAYDNHVYVVAVNAVGPDGAGNFYFGHSMIIDPTAHKLALGRGTEEIIHAELTLGETETISYGISAKRVFNHLDDINESLMIERIGIN